MNNVWSARMPMPTELLIGNKSSLQLPRPEDNMQAMPGRETTTSGCKHPQHQQTTSTISNTSLDETTCALETS
jgi:hypothetical protein